MKIEYKTGNALKGPERYTVHGCNSRGVMGRGIALEVKTDFPEAFRAYRVAFEARRNGDDGLALGTTIWAACGERTIINAITQRDYIGGPPGTIYVDYDAIAQVMRQIDDRAYYSANFESVREATRGVVDRVAMPLIGAGLAGGSWSKISEIIETESKHFQPVVYLFDGKMPTS